MVKRRGDNTPVPPGGAAAERLRMFEQARGRPVAPTDNTAPSEQVVDKTKKPNPTGRKRDEEQQRRGD